MIDEHPSVSTDWCQSKNAAVSALYLPGTSEPALECRATRPLSRRKQGFESPRSAIQPRIGVPKVSPGGVRATAALLARGNAAAAYEHSLKGRILIVEFPSLEKGIAAHDSPAYQEALKALGNGAVRDVRVVEGVE
jgi:uncharacterized protein (DUF1330 family)